MSLAASPPNIDDNRPLIVSREDGKIHKGINSNRLHIKRYAVDKDDIISGERCDYLLLTERNCAYLIELKGNHVDKACSQILTTYLALRDDLKTYTVFVRIIPSRNTTHTINGTNFKKLRQHFSKDKIQIKSVYLEEELS